MRAGWLTFCKAPAQSFKRLARSQGGAAALEFGLVAAPFLALLVALFQTGMVFFAGRVLDEVVADFEPLHYDRTSPDVRNEPVRIRNLCMQPDRSVV